MSTVRHSDDAPTGALLLDSLDEALRSLTVRYAGERLASLLDRLAALGFSWRDIARVAGVSVPELRKWRRGEWATSAGRQRVARFVALCEVAAERCHIADIAAWLERPLHPEAPLTGLDLVEAERLDLVLALARDRPGGPEQVLDEFDPDWRAWHRSDVEVFTAADGKPGLRLAGADRWAASLVDRSA
ncbi:hypothetical protein [Candidatus Poriferisodalis sp.]|uniref:hypothetical protein n=1 Tax=Candidatus Poriferisodalis sp. TaxID=3101277 RepID=UPI003B02BDF9